MAEAAAKPKANWYWAEGETQQGPVTLNGIAKLVAQGKLGGEDMIWKEGSAAWIAVNRVPALVKFIKAPVTSAAMRTEQVTRSGVGGAPAIEPLGIEPPVLQPIAAAPAPEVGYYNPSSGMPPRAAATLAKHARPRGDTGDWPLDDGQVNQFDLALKYRKKIDGAASLFRLLYMLIAIGDIFILIGAAAAYATAGSSRAAAAAFALLFALAICVGLTVLYYFAWKGTSRSQRWAPLTMGIVFSIGGLFNLAQIAIGSAAPGNAAPSLAGGIIGIVIAAAFAYVAFQAFVAIPGYLTQPAWCQELLSKTSK